MTTDLSFLDAPENNLPPRAARPAAYRRLGLVALVYAYRLVAGLVIAVPFAALLHGTIAGYPRGDAELFDPGGLMLLEALRLGRRAFLPVAAAGGLVAILATMLGLLPLAALIAGLGREGRISRGFLASRAFDALGTLALLGGLTLAAQAALTALITLLGAKAIDALQLQLDARADTFAHLGLAALVLLAVVALGGVRDVAIIAAVHDADRFYNASSRALAAAARAGGRLAWAYAWRAALTLALLALAAAVGGHIALPFVAHQIAIAAAVFLRASWLSAAMRLLERAAPTAGR